MKAFIVMVALFASANAAQADGFKCQTLDGDLSIKAYNHTDASEGTRTGAVMVLSDPAVSSGRKTIARFTDVNGVLTSQGARYTANVDLRFNDSKRKGELILGTKLGELDQVIVSVDFTYGQNLEKGEMTSGEITLVKRNGKKIHSELECERYLKN